MGNTNQNTLPPDQVRRYFLFVHYGVKKDEIISERRRLTLKDSLYGRLRKDLQYLVDIVGRGDENSPKWEGRAFVFVDVGWTDLLKTESITAARTLAIDLQKIHHEIVDRLCLAECRRNTCRECRDQRVAPWPVPIRIITAADLIELLTTIDELEEWKPYEQYDQSKQRSRLSQHLVGDVETLRYDASKAIEGMIRIANVGRNIPIFRFDDDVIFYGQRVYDMCWEEPNKQGEDGKLKTWTQFQDEGSLLTDMKEYLAGGKKSPSQWREEQIKATRKSILKLCARYDRASANPKLHYFAFSGHYNSEGKDNLNKLLNVYATRVVQLARLPDNPNDAKLPEKADEAEDQKEEVAKEVRMHEEAASEFLDKLLEIGANQERQIISGAGLCLSDGAILDLPPYSNMRANVMWIDDHLKYALHDELEHFDVHILEVGPAREADACFPQLRHAKPPTYEDVKWHRDEYMPRLLLGCIADAWLRKTPEMKKKTLKGVAPPFLPDDFVRARQLRKKDRPHVYAKAFLNAVPAGASDKDAWALHSELWEVGVKRLERICELWSDDLYQGTFLGLFLKGDKHKRCEEFRDYIPKNYPEGLETAVGEMRENNPYKDNKYRDKSPKDCIEKEKQYAQELKLDSLRLSDSLRVLIRDFIEYFETVEFWNRYVRAVRFLVHRSGQSRELKWLFPPDESYGESIRIESIVHVLEQLMDLHLDQKDFKALVHKGQPTDNSENQEGKDAKADVPSVENWRELGHYTNNKDPQVTMDASAIKSYAKENNYRADALWLIVRCYHLAHAIVIRGHGHDTVALDGVGWEESAKWKGSDRFALVFTYFFLQSEGKRDELNLLKRLEPKLESFLPKGTSLKERSTKWNDKLYAEKAKQ